MRAFHNLYSGATGKPTKEHYCPVGPLNSIDRLGSESVAELDESAFRRLLINLCRAAEDVRAIIDIDYGE